MSANIQGFNLTCFITQLRKALKKLTNDQS